MDTQQRDTLWSLMSAAKVAMLTTDTDGDLRARPLALVQKEFEGELWFFTHASTPKIGEVEADRHVGVTFSDPGARSFVSLSGTAGMVRDRASIDRYWSELLSTWFPKGKDDPDLALLRVSVSSAEYWDAPSSTVVHAYGYLKSKLTGTPPDGGDNEKIKVS